MVNAAARFLELRTAFEEKEGPGARPLFKAIARWQKRFARATKQEHTTKRDYSLYLMGTSDQSQRGFGRSSSR